MTKQLNNSKTIQKSSLEISLVGLKITKRNRKLAKTKSLLMAAKNVMIAHHLVKLAEMPKCLKQTVKYFIQEQAFMRAF